MLKKFKSYVVLKRQTICSCVFRQEFERSNLKLIKRVLIMDGTIYTIGYAGFSRDIFIQELKKYTISVLIDVRSSPFSSFHSEYNKDILKAALKKNNIYYRNYAKEFGARQDNLDLYTSDGYLDFEKVAQSDDFQNGLSKLCNSIKQGYIPALMCAEINPFDCHRAILVSRAFYECGYNVIHILPKGRTCGQNDVNKALLDKYFPDRSQLSFFERAEEDKLIKEAYKKRNAEIGYKITEGDKQ